jgi:hypothetical protein
MAGIKKIHHRLQKVAEPAAALHSLDGRPCILQFSRIILIFFFISVKQFVGHSQKLEIEELHGAFCLL